MLTPHAQSEYTTTALISVMMAGTAAYIEAYWLIPLPIVAALAVLAFFRDPDRAVPASRNVMVSPADGKVVSVHEVPAMPEFDGHPALCVRIFLSLFDVHINRSPCHGRVIQVVHRDGVYGNAMNPESAEQNEAMLTVLKHPAKDYPLTAVRQIAGMVARRIVCHTKPGMTLQRGQRFGLIKFGSCVELYLPDYLEPEVQVTEGDRVRGGEDVIAVVMPPLEAPEPAIVPADEVEVSDMATEPEEAEAATSTDAAR